MSKRYEMHWPFGGLSDDRAFSAQEKGTTRDAQNVRNIDPVDGRSKGSQRAGQSKYMPPVLGAAPVVDMQVVTRDAVKIEYINRTGDLGDTGTFPDAPEWTAESEDFQDALAVAVDLQENVYTVSAQGILTKFNSAGVKLRSVTIPAVRGSVVVPKVEVDLNGGVVVAVGADTNLKGAVFRYADNALNNTELEQDWEIVTTGRVSMFALDTYSVFVVQEHGVGLENFTLTRYDNTQDGVDPTLTVTQECPGPVNQIVIDGNGAVKMVVEGVVDKGVVPDALEFTKRIDETLLWTPADLTDADERIFSWIDATNIDGFGNATLTDGDTVDVWEDVRPINVTGLFDTTVRRLVTDEFQAYAGDARPGPTYLADMGNGLPGVHFDANAEPAIGPIVPLLGQCMFSEGTNFGTTPKTTSTEAMTGQASMWPGYDSATVDAEAKYVMCMVVRVRKEDFASVLFSQPGEDGENGADPGFVMSPSILLNARAFNQTATNQDQAWDDVPGWVTYFNGKFGGAATQEPINYGNAPDQSPPPTTPRDNNQLQSFEFGEDGLLMVTLVIDRQTEPLYADDPTRKSQFRINGRPIADFTSTIPLNGDSIFADAVNRARSLFGSRRRHSDVNNSDYFGDSGANDDPITARPLNAPQGLQSFNGEMMEFITVLAGSTGGAVIHDKVVQNFNTTAEKSVNSELYATSQWLARQEAEAATEVELIEGYLAHKWGMAHKLQHGSHDETAASEVPNGAFNHPFGGTGNYPGKPIVGTDPDPQRNPQSEWREGSTLLKYQAGTLDLAWALSGGGVGFSCGVDESQSALAIGPEDYPTTGNEENLGPSNQADDDIVLRKVADHGSQYDIQARSRGALQFLGYNDLGAGSSVPADSETFTITVDTDAGLNAQVYTYKTVLTPLPNEILLAANVQTTVINTVAVLVATLGPGGSAVIGSDPDGDLYASNVGHWDIELVAIFESDTQMIVTTNAPSGIRVYGGVQGSTGSTIEDAWKLTDVGGGGVRRSNMIAADDEDDWWVPDWKDGLPERMQKFDGETGNAGPFYDMPQAAHAVALPLSHPLYLPIDPDNPPGTPPTGPLFMYVAGATLAASDTLHKVRLITEDQNLTLGETPRQTFTVGIVDGDLVQFTRDSGTVTVLVNDGLNPASPYIASTVMFNTVYALDGRSYIFWDATIQTGGVFASRSGGEIPKNAKLITSWRGRLVLSRNEDDPHNVFFSRIGDPYNWDLFPAVPDGLEATTFTNSRVGRNADVVNSLVSYSDDLLIVGGDHTIQVLRGDPLADGQLDLITDATGMAFGECWCKDPNGVLYFFGSRGGVYRWVPGGAGPVRITRDRIERRMQDLDLTTVRIRLAWNWRDEGVHVFVVPLEPVATGATLPSWFMDKHGAWWEDSWAETVLQPHSARVIDGDDPSDRVLLLGGDDGQVRFWDAAAKDDDGTRIDAHVLIGPLMPGTESVAFGFKRPEVVLTTGKDGCLFELIGASSAEAATDPEQRADLKPGRNERLPISLKDSAVYARLRNSELSGSFGFESMTIEVRAAGRHRP